MALASKRSVMTLYSASDIDSHRTRIVLAEKGILVDVIEVDRHDDLTNFHGVNPYKTTPTLVDRDLVLYKSRIIMEYLDERFPHPPLLPVYPIARAESRLQMYRVEQDWHQLIKKIQENQSSQEVSALRKELVESFMKIIPIFNNYDYFMHDDFSMVDCCIAPILWRLPKLDIQLPTSAKSLLNYADKLFNRDSFQASLTETEREFRGS
jgi:RNA polymerase-associated protein